MKRVLWLVTAGLLWFGVACSGGSDDENNRMLDGHRDALEKAKGVESLLKKADANRLNELQKIEDE